MMLEPAGEKDYNACSPTSTQPMTADPARVVCLSADLFPSPRGFGQSSSRLDDSKLEDLLEFFTPDAIFLVGTTYNSVAMTMLERVTDIPIFAPGWENTPQSETLNGVSIYSTPSVDDLNALSSAEANGMLDPSETTYILSNELSLEVDTESLETRLSGIDAYEDAIDSLDYNYSHISGSLPGDYEHTWNGMDIHGAQTVETQNQPSITCLQLYPSGRTTTKTLDSNKLGMQAINGLGPSKVGTLEQNGYASRDDIAEAGIDDLAELSGIGEKTARQLTGHARALEHDEVVLSDDDPLPGRNPVYIDIETDGLNPTIIWEIGVLDSETNEYHDYMVKDPDDKGKAVTEFMVDVTNKWNDRVFVAWNGNGFDYKHLERHISRYCPDFLETWHSLYTLDLLYWADGKNNAILPGRTNKLESVSEALGYTRQDTDLTGKEVGEKYRTWMRNTIPENELDWEDHERYCEHDVRALAAIYNAIAEAEMPALDGNTHGQKQQSLLDY